MLQVFDQLVCELCLAELDAQPKFTICILIIMVVHTLEGQFYSSLSGYSLAVSRYSFDATGLMD